MKNSMPFVLILIAVIFLFSCSDTKTEAEYYKLAYDQYNDGKYDESVNNFQSLLENYPEGQNTPNAMFMIGFICANHSEKLDEAKKYYNMFMEKYPDHELVSSAKYELETLGKDINELDIFKKIEEEEKEN
ncbi:MAG: tetratricopeptide repeat protein [Calditrichia bacterium]|nr:tetratricopeptide repeat protein [Calditrichia bacterium]